ALVGLGASLGLERAYTGWGRARRWMLNTVVVGGAALLAGLTLRVTMDSVFDRWAALPAVHDVYNGRLGRLASYLDRHPDGQTTSICTFRLDPQPIGEHGLSSASFSDRYLLEWMLHRPADGLRYSNCVSGMVLTRGGEPQRFAFADTAGPRALAEPFGRWLAGAQPVAVPGLSTGLALSVDAQQAVADTFGQTIQSEIAYAPETVGPSDFAVLPIRMGGYLTFEGYEFEPPGPFRPGDTFTVVTYWRADGEQVRGLSLFVHVMRNPYTAPVLQNDIFSIDESLLENRDVFIQLVPISIPADFPPGDYLVSLGGYSTVSGARLPIFDEDQERGNRLFLRPIHVE
ncbi:MAG: hypothetical protein IT323_03230, partial [Anaerolineae bacterium]|nr:hypothetical protein [Anaerolineae bacterium]